MVNKYFHIFFIFHLLICIVTVNTLTESEISQSVDEKIITCGSSIRIQNIMTKFNLFSNKLTWGSGSYMQIITAIQETDSNDSLFIIKEGLFQSECTTGTAINCNSVIRLEHVATGRNLHSHNFPSYITGSQEVCGFGENGIGDINDNFQIICYNSNQTAVLQGKTHFLLQHVVTKKFLYIDIQKSLFNEYNCRGCPIFNHREVSCTDKKDKQGLWKIIGGIIYQHDKNEIDINSDL